jgi:hypothetical protein
VEKARQNQRQPETVHTNSPHCPKIPLIFSGRNRR